MKNLALSLSCVFLVSCSSMHNSENKKIQNNYLNIISFEETAYKYWTELGNLSREHNDDYYKKYWHVQIGFLTNSDNANTSSGEFSNCRLSRHQAISLAEKYGLSVCASKKLINVIGLESLKKLILSGRIKPDKYWKYLNDGKSYIAANDSTGSGKKAPYILLETVQKYFHK